MLIEQFHKFIDAKSLINKDDKILLSVSGGRDSVALCKLFFNSKIDFEIAHCNYHLRNEDSNRDQRFVADLARKCNVAIHVAEFDTAKYAADNSLSIEMAARKLRYDWYRVLCEKYGFTKIATAHHLNDQAETFFINILRTTGINGLCGIPVKRPLSDDFQSYQIIRPLLFASRKDIDNYLINDTFVDDYTNDTNDYLRNKIRHNIIPELETISPDFPKTLQKSVTRLSFTKDFINKIMLDYFPKSCADGVDKIIIPKNFSFDELCGYIYFALADYGFNSYQLSDIAASVNSVGKSFYNHDFELIIDRDFFLVRKKIADEVVKSVDEHTYLINGLNFVLGDVDKAIIKDFGFSVILTSDIWQKPVNQQVAFLDFDKLKFPLKISNKKTGDVFYPLGMKHKKKLSDFLIDLKVDRYAKDKILTVRDVDDNIIWVVGYRIDNRYKVDDDTEKILIIKYKCE